jgi:hypothetical protein
MLTEFERKAWDARGKARDHSPVTALKAVIEDIESGNFPNLKHVAVVLIMETDETQCVSVVQAGPCGNLAIQGALHRAAGYFGD